MPGTNATLFSTAFFGFTLGAVFVGLVTFLSFTSNLVILEGVTVGIGFGILILKFILCKY